MAIRMKKATALILAYCMICLTACGNGGAQGNGTDPADTAGTAGEVGMDSAAENTADTGESTDTDSAAEGAVASIGKKDIEEMIADGKDIEVDCHFCNKKYVFSVEELKRLIV